MTPASAGLPGGSGAPIVQYWHEEEPPAFIAELLSSVAEHNPDSEHLVFSAATAEELIGAHCGERAVGAFRACALPAMQADYFRYCAVHALGGIYIDADYRCLGSVMGLLDDHPNGVLFGRRYPALALADVFAWPYPVGRFRTVVNGVFGFGRAGHPLLGLARELATANIESRLGEGPAGVWLSTGPGVFTALYLLHELGSAEAFDAFASGTVLAPAAPLLRQVGADPERVSGAFEGVDIRPLQAAGELLAEVPTPTGHRARHWAASAEEIYR